MRGNRLCLLVILSLVCGPHLASGQSGDATPTSVPDLASHLRELISPVPPAPYPLVPRSPSRRNLGFREIARAAGMIFSGTVTKVQRHPATAGQSVETIAITFHIETAIRGVTPNDDVTITQWAGLWSSGQRYRIGERVLLFLYPPSKVGLTSCVAGPIGLFHIDPWGRIQLSAQHISLLRRDSALGGKSRLVVGDFASAVRRASEEE
jgi:hypothetical protein